MAKISLNPKYDTHYSGSTSWALISKNNIKYYKSQNKSNSSDTALKCEFTTPYDNIDIQVEIGASSETNYDWCYIGKLDNSNPTYDSNYIDRISGYNNFKTITINVAKAGTHFLIIGYRKDGSSSSYDDCGYFRLITTEVDSIEPTKTKYIYCGTKKTFKPIEFSKSDSNGVWNTYTGSDNMYQWTTDGASSNINNIAKILFKTTSDNIELDLIYHIYFNSRQAKFCVGSVDNASLSFSSSDYIYEKGLMEKTVSKKIIVPKAGDHFINIGCFKYDRYKDAVDIGFSGSNIIMNTLTPDSILANNKDISEVYVGSEFIWEKSKIMWFQNKSQEINFVNNSDGNTLNGKVTIPTNTYDKFSYGNNVISGSNDHNSSAYYGIKVKDIINNGYIYLVNYQRAMDLSAFPNPVNMEYRHGWSNRVGSCMFLKINPRLGKETTSMSNMFMAFNKENYNSGFTEPLIVNHKACNIVGLDKLNTSNISNMNNMFYYSRIVGNLDFSNWDTGKVTDMAYMFHYSNGSNKNYNGTEYDIDNYSYITGINNWNLKSVNDMHYMFNSSTYYDFQDKELAWNTSNVTDMSYMFAYCNAYNFPKLSFDTRNVTNMAYMFTSFKSYNDLKLNFTDTSKVTDMSGMFGNSMDIQHNKYKFSYFNYHGNADISCLDTSNVVNANNMFRSCIYLTPDKIKNIRLPKATKITNMFLGCYMGGWDFINQKNTYIDTIDLSNLDLGYINGPYFTPIRHAFAFGSFRNMYFVNNKLVYDDYPINTYINNLILDNWKCFANYSYDIKMTLDDSPFYGCHVTYCYMRGCNSNTKAKIKQMLGLNTYNSTYASCSYFIED